MKTIIGLHAKARVGKDTAGQVLSESGFQRIAFADPIWEFIAKLLGITRRELEGVKDEPSPILGGNTPRRAAQTLGTEWGVDTMCNTLWADLAMREILSRPEKAFVITDVRFDHEARVIAREGGRIIEICGEPRSQVDNGDHRSESGISDNFISARVYNTGTIANLRHQLLTVI